MMKQVTATELAARLHAGEDLQLVDVREDWEHSEFNIGGIHIPLGELMDNETNIAKDKPVIIYCQKGIRSQVAIQRLQQREGFENLENLTGGMKAWKENQPKSES